MSNNNREKERHDFYRKSSLKYSEDCYQAAKQIDPKMPIIAGIMGTVILVIASSNLEIPSNPLNNTLKTIIDAVPLIGGLVNGINSNRLRSELLTMAKLYDQLSREK